PALASPIHFQFLLPLTVDRSLSYRPVICRQETYGKAHRPGSGNPRRSNTEDSCAAADARVGNRAAHPAAFERSLASRPGRALSSIAPARATRLDSGEVGRIGEQSPREVLLAHARRRQIPTATTSAVEPP